MKDSAISDEQIRKRYHLDQPQNRTINQALKYNFNLSKMNIL